jgi:DNA-binding transcriptional ArsR family regulator
MDRNGDTRVIDPQAVQTASAVMPDGSGESRIEANLETLCSPVRVKIMRALAESELAAGDLALVIGRSRSATSQHLKVLRETGVVTSQRNGNVVNYRLAEGRVPQLLAQIAKRLDDA